MIQVAQLDICALREAYEARVRARCPDLLPSAQRLRVRLDPDRWTLEWYMPWWVGLAYGLDEETCAQIVLGNVLGMAALRLEDDLADGELDPDDELSADELSGVLYQAAIDAFRQILPIPSAFWDELGQLMTDWQSVTHDPSLLSAGGGGDAAALQSGALARRGAPLKVSAFAVCQLAGRQDAYPTLDKCLDHALAALVLYDHFCDWETDLEAGRWNAFVAGASAHGRLSGVGIATRSRVFGSMMAGGAVSFYFGRIDRELRLAARLAARADVPALVDHLQQFNDRLAEHGRIAQAHYKRLGERSMALMFGTP